jgi:hypothetical protein
MEKEIEVSGEIAKTKEARIKIAMRLIWVFGTFKKIKTYLDLFHNLGRIGA